ncbi:MAG: virulence factor SrfB, partial [Burkholderiales bacterium]|nr:virulence factor SrfB [Burkholderiales bacterium]
MLSAIHSYEDQTTLIMGSGVQFLDFAATFVVKGKSGEFAKIGDAGPIARLEEDERTGKLHFSFDERKQASQATLDLGVDQSLKLLLDTWIPIPYFRFSPPSRFEEGPSNWARAR